MQLTDNYIVKFCHQNHSQEKERYVAGETAKHPITGEDVTVQFLVTPEPTFTECRIYAKTNFIENPDNKVVQSRGYHYIQVGIGVAKLHQGDKFSKEQGRMKSFKKAMESADFPKQRRTELWEAYRTSTPNGRWKNKTK